MMESSELLRRKIKQHRRKERAEQVKKERGGNDADDDTASPPLKKPRRKPRKSDAEEDVIDGFAIAAFRKYEDLTVSASIQSLKGGSGSESNEWFDFSIAGNQGGRT